MYRKQSHIFAAFIPVPVPYFAIASIYIWLFAGYRVPVIGEAGYGTGTEYLAGFSIQHSNG
jgi:hypothetical protein